MKIEFREINRHDYRRHVHIWGYPVLNEVGDKIRTTEDLIGFRTKYPELYDRTLTEDPIDNSDALIAHMDEAGIDRTQIQARPGSVTNDQIAISVRRHPDRLYGLMRIGHDQEAAYEYVEDPAPIRAAAANIAVIPGMTSISRSRHAGSPCSRASNNAEAMANTPGSPDDTTATLRPSAASSSA